MQVGNEIAEAGEDNRMNARIFPVYVFVFALFVSLGVFLYIPSDLMSGWLLALVAFNLLVATANILVAYWVYEDSDFIENVRNAESRLYSKVDRLEGIVDDNFDLVDDRLKKLEQKS